MNYVSQVEGEPREGSLGPGKEWEVVHQFQLLCTFGLKATFDIDKNLIELNCREKPKHFGDRYLPSKFTTRFFKPTINGTKEEIENFIKLIDKVIGLPREQYTAVIRCLTNFSDALQVLNFNLDLAYSMLVYSLEALSQNFDGYQAIWIDHPQNEQLDKILSSLELETSEKIRNILIKDKQFKLTRRFINFISSHIDDNFFIAEAETIQNALRKSDLEQALKNVYNSRSKYVHSLSPVPNHLKYSQITDGDVFHWKKQPYFTFNGLVRLTHHVLTNFIEKQEYLEREDYDYFLDIPGIITMRVAPEYSLWNEHSFSASQARKWLSGFLDNLVSFLISQAPVTNLEKVMDKLETLIKGVNKETQRTMFVLHKLYYCLTGNQEKHLPLVKDYEYLMTECHIETMIASLFFSKGLPWNIHECIDSYKSYSKKRFETNTVEIPRLIDILLIVDIANKGLLIEETEIYETWLTNACLEAAGMPALQDVIQEAKDQSQPVLWDEIVESFKQPSQP